MPADFSTAAIEAVSAPARAPVMTFPEPFASLMKDRIRHPLGTHFGITNFGVNLTYLPPGASRRRAIPIRIRMNLCTFSRARPSW